MRVLITGYAGYIGAVMIPKLLSEGHEIIGLDTGYFDGRSFGEFAPRIVTLRRDLRLQDSKTSMQS